MEENVLRYCVKCYLKYTTYIINPGMFLKVLCTLISGLYFNIPLLHRIADADQIFLVQTATFSIFVNRNFEPVPSKLKNSLMKKLMKKNLGFKVPCWISTTDILCE